MLQYLRRAKSNERMKKGRAVTNNLCPHSMHIMFIKNGMVK